MMKAQLKYCPDLRACVLEDRLVPVVPNLGVGTIVLTTGGYVLDESLPRHVADPNGASGSPGFLTPSAMTGSGGSPACCRRTVPAARPPRRRRPDRIGEPP